MELDPVFAGDVAVLAAASALLHYALGLYGMVVVFALLAFVENGASLWKELSQRSFQLWHALSARSMSDGDGADAKKPKTLDRQQTWHFGRATPRDERTRSDARTELAEDDEVDDVSDLLNDQLLETANANSTNSANDIKPEVPPMDPVTQQLLARLSIRDVASAGDKVVAVNARAPVAFETDLFAGHALFLVRTAPEDPHYASLFLGKRRMFWIQVQGRFKRRPRGPVFLGGELPGRISLGLFTKSIARVILGIVQSLLGNVYMSFGAASSVDADALDELPAVAFPLYQSVDQFMVTPAGETPPPLGTLDFGESDQARARRRQTPLGRGGDHVFDVGPTYSFHFHTMYVDLSQWKTANLPGLSDMQLATFFDSLPLRLVAYDVGEQDSGSHLQQHKQYLFNFEVAFDAQRPRGMWRSDSEQSLASSSSESTGMASTTESTASSSSTSPFPTVVAGDDQVAIHDGLATVDRENARALQNIELQYLFWMEEVDLEMGVRRVQYVFRLRENCGAGEGEDDREKRVTEQLVVVSAYRLRLLLGSKFRRLRRLYTLQSLRFHTRSRIDSYSIICDEARSVAVCLERILSLSRGTDPYTYSEDNEALVVAFESALYQLLTVRSHLQLPHDGAALSTELTPAAIGAKLSQRDRDTIGVVSEGVVYRFYGDSLVRQELLVLTPEALLFYRSQSSSPDKTIKCNSVIGVQTTRVPYASSSGGDFAWAFQINTFAEEMVVCVATEHVRNTWIRVVLQQSSPHANFDRSFLAPLAVCFTPTKPLKPANRVELNSRSLFPRRNSRPMDQDAVAMVSTALRSALRVHALEERADVMTILEFLNHASALRTIDLARVMDRPHEERLAFFLNLYHVVLAHAMIAHGFPRTKAQWEDFQTHMCYVVGKDPRDAQQSLSLSLAEIEHVILRARLPPASELPHLRLSSLAPEFASRLTPLGMAHPDFRVSFALLMNHDRKGSQDVTVFHGDTIHEQLNAVVKGYVAQHVEIDTLRKTIFLPRICEWFKHDFGGGGSPLYCVRKLLGFLDDAVQQQALEVLDSPTLVHIKYGAFAYVPRTTLRLARPAIGNHADER